MNMIIQQKELSVTARATKLIASFFKDKKKKPVRIFVQLGGCGIRNFGVALENPKPSDRVYEIDGYTYVINKKLLRFVQPITFDSDGVGFRISGSGIYPSQGCGACGNMCNSNKGNRCCGECDVCTHQCVYSKA